MKDVKGTLERIDAEIVTRRQNIAYHQVEIARLEDTRKVLMGLVEDDIERAEQRRNPDVLTTPVVHSITVRKVGAADEGPPPKTNGHAPGMNKSGDRRGMHSSPRGGAVKPKPRRPTAEIPPEEKQEYLRERVLTVLKSYGYAMDTSDIRKALGMDKEWHKSRKVKALYNAIGWLTKTGAVVKDPTNFELSLPQ